MQKFYPAVIIPLKTAISIIDLLLFLDGRSYLDIKETNVLENGLLIYHNIEDLS